MLTEQAKALGIHPSQQKKEQVNAETKKNKETGKTEKAKAVKKKK